MRYFAPSQASAADDVQQAHPSQPSKNTIINTVTLTTEGHALPFRRDVPRLAHEPCRHTSRSDEVKSLPQLFEYEHPRRHQPRPHRCATVSDDDGGTISFYGRTGFCALPVEAFKPLARGPEHEHLACHACHLSLILRGAHEARPWPSIRHTFTTPTNVINALWLRLP